MTYQCKVKVEGAWQSTSSRKAPPAPRFPQPSPPHLTTYFMSQDQPAKLSQHDPKGGAAKSQTHGTFSPNMPSFDSMYADPFDTLPFGAGMPSFLPSTHILFRHPLSSYTPQFLDFGDPFLGQFQGPPFCAMTSTEVPHSSNNTTKLSQRANFKSPKELNSQLPVRALWPNFPPGYVPQPGHGYSRLPSSDVARKAPRKSSASSPAQPSPPQLANGTPKPRQGRTAKQDYHRKHGSPLPSECTSTAKNSTARATKPASPAQRSTPLESLTLLTNLTPLKGPKSPHPSSARSRPVVLDDEDDEDESDDDDLPLRTTLRTENGCTPVRGPTTITANPGRHNRYRANPSRSRPRPRFEYSVPEELQGIHRALGEDNWSDYIILLEKKAMKQITETQFVAKSKGIFMVFNDRTRERIERQVVRTMVLPAIEQHRNNNQEH